MRETTSQEVLEYISQKGWEHKEVSPGEYNIETGCPFCNDGKKNHFYISEKGLWSCKKCGENGNLYQLKEKLGDLKSNKPTSSKLDVQKPKVVIKEKKIERNVEKTIKDEDLAYKYYADLFKKKNKLVLDYLKKLESFHFPAHWTGRRFTSLVRLDSGYRARILA